MIAGTHHHPRSLNLFLVFLSVNMGVLFFFRGELANRFFLCMAFARYFSLFHHLHSVIWFPPDFFPALLGWRRDDLTPPFSEHESKWSEGVDDDLFLARRSKCLFFLSFLLVLFWGNGLVVVTGLTVDTLPIYTSHLTGSAPVCCTVLAGNSRIWRRIL